MELSITKELTFDAGHRIENLPKEHPCSRQHGHTYNVKITVALHLFQGGAARRTWSVNDIKSILDKNNGMLIDFGQIKEVINRLDHQNLNDVVSFNPTVENLVLYLRDEIEGILPEHLRVKELEIWETSTSSAKLVN